MNHKVIQADTSIFEIRWTFTPTDYFDKEFEFLMDGIVVHVGHGEAIVRLDAKPGITDKNLHEQLSDSLLERFRNVQILSHARFTLSHPKRCVQHSDGKTDFFLDIYETLSLSSTSFPIDIVCQDQDGNVIRDSRKERAQQKSRFHELCDRHRSDPLLQTMRRGISDAVENPEYCLVHLYEVLDAAQKHFRGGDKACDKLKLSKTQWHDVKGLCNCAPFIEGRHHGQSGADIHPVSDAEKAEVQRFATQVISRYLEWKERSKINDDSGQ